MQMGRQKILRSLSVKTRYQPEARRCRRQGCGSAQGILHLLQTTLLSRSKRGCISPGRTGSDGLWAEQAMPPYKARQRDASPHTQNDSSGSQTGESLPPRDTWLRVESFLVLQWGGGSASS